METPVSSHRRNTILVLMVIALLGVAASASAQAGPFTRLQVLLPGEEAAPGTATGKIGTPESQTVGVPFSVRVRACDDAWNTVTGITDVIAIGSSDESAGLPGDAPLTAGERQFTLTFNAAGAFTVSADDLSDGTIAEAQSASVEAMALHGFVFSSINQKNQYAGVPMQITVSAVSPGGDIVTGYDGPVQLQELTSYGVGRIEPAEVVLSNGTWSGGVTSYRADETSINRGAVNIYAYLAGQPGTNGTSDPFTVHPGPLARVQLVVPGQDPLPGSVSGVSGQPATQGAGQDFLVDVFATDDYWNPLPSDHTVRVTSSDDAASTPVTGALSGGHTQFTVALGTAGQQTLTVSDLSDGSIQGQTSPPIPVIPSAVHHFLVGDIPDQVQAGEPVTVTIEAVDSADNLLVDYAGDARLSANTGAGTISPETISFTAGQWSGTMVFRGAGGAVSFTCADYASPPHSGTSENFVVAPGPYSGLQVLAPGEQPQGGSADGFTGSAEAQAAGTPFQLRLRAVDEFANRVPGVASRLALACTDTFFLGPDPITLDNGEITIPVTAYRAGLQSFTATDLDSSGVADGVSREIEVQAGAYEKILLLAPGEELAPGAENGRSGEATDQSINFAFTVTVLATDSWWNPIGGISDQVELSSSDALAQLPAPATMLDGRANLAVRLSTGGYQQITASNLSRATIPVSTTQVRAISSGLHLEASVTPTTVQAGEPFTLTVRVTNDAGSLIQEINSDVDVEVQNASTQEPGFGTLATTQFQLLQGERAIQQTYTGAETIVLIVRDEAGNTPAVTEPLTILPGAPAVFTLEGERDWVRANRHATVAARLADAYDNGVPEQAVSFSVVGGFGQLTPVDEATGVSGAASADFLSPRQAGVTTLRAECAGFSAELDLETTLVDKDAAGGTLTNYPNPFHPDEAPTTIAYVLDDDARVRLRIYTLSGGLVLDREYASGSTGGSAGLNEVAWDGRNGEGQAVASGGYVLYVQAEGEGVTMHVMRRKLGVVR
jgi:hypothetical protein